MYLTPQPLGPGEFGQVVAPAVALPKVTGVVVRTAGTSHADNCCGLCPTNLGVGQGGTGSNGIEMIFTLSGHRAGVEYDITRTRRDSIWERRGGVWTRLDASPMGTNDDHHDGDECLSVRGNRIFVIDTPGFTNAFPRPAGTIFGTFTPGVTSHADATDIVVRFSFAEWVIARDKANGIPWKAISTGPFVFWHSITWIRTNGAGQWVLDAARSAIGRGSLSAAVINSAPVP